MITVPIENSQGLLQWPSDVPEQAWLLAYTHSQLRLENGVKALEPDTLYEAWAFDGKISWHMWQRDDQWVCTTFDTASVDQRYILERRQILSNIMIKQLADKQVRVQYLIIREWIQFDEDGQAYVAYSCPINLV